MLLKLAVPKLAAEAMRLGQQIKIALTKYPATIPDCQTNESGVRITLISTGFNILRLS